MKPLSFLENLFAQPPGKPLHAESTCTFCDKDRKHVGQLILGPDLSICDECIATVSRMVIEAPQVVDGQEDSWELGDESDHCNFCTRDCRWTWRVMKKQLRGCICTECLELCNEIVFMEMEKENRIRNSSALLYENFASQLGKLNQEKRPRLLKRLKALLSSHR